MNNQTTNKLDPDPWVITTVIIGALGTLGTWIQIARSPSKTKATDDTLTLTSALEEPLSADLRDAIRGTKRLLKLLSRTEIGKLPVLELQFRYGNGPMLLDTEDFKEFERLTDSLFTSARFIHSSVLGIIKFHPERAKYLGILALNSQLDAVSAIDSYFRKDMTFGQVLDHALDLLIGYEKLLDRMTMSN